LAAVKQDYWTIQYVKKQTDEICMAAVEQYKYFIMTNLEYSDNYNCNFLLRLIQYKGHIEVFCNFKHTDSSPNFISSFINTNRDIYKLQKEKTELLDSKGNRMLTNLENNTRESINDRISKAINAIDMNNNELNNVRNKNKKFKFLNNCMIKTKIIFNPENIINLDSLLNDMETLKRICYTEKKIEFIRLI